MPSRKFNELPPEEKSKLRIHAIREIEKYCVNAKALIVTHYHYDHHRLPSDPALVTKGKFWLNVDTLLLKNPNQYINESQWKRARLFLSELLLLSGDTLENHLSAPKQLDFEDLVEKLDLALSKNFGDYNKRRKDLLKKGKQWFNNLISRIWTKKPWIEEFKIKDGPKFAWIDGRKFEFGNNHRHGGIDMDHFF